MYAVRPSVNTAKIPNLTISPLMRPELEAVLMGGSPRWPTLSPRRRRARVDGRGGALGDPDQGDARIGRHQELLGGHQERLADDRHPHDLAVGAGVGADEVEV